MAVTFELRATDGVSAPAKQSADAMRGTGNAAAEASPKIDRFASATKGGGDAAAAAVAKLDANTAALGKLDAQQAAAGRSADLMGKLIGGSVAAIAAGYVAFTTKALDSINDVYDATVRLGASAETLSTLGVVARSNGSSVEAMDKALSHLSDTQAKAAGGSKQDAELFSALGISATEATGHVKGLDDLVPQIAAKFATYADGPAKAALANKLFGEGGDKLIGTLNELGDDGFDKAKEKAVSFGLLISTDTAKAAHKLDDELDALKLTTSGYFVLVAQDILPNLILFAHGLADQANAAADSNEKTTAMGDAIRGTLGFLVTLDAEVQKGGAYFGYYADQVGIAIDKIKAKITNPGYLSALASALSGNPSGAVAMNMLDGAADRQFAGRSAASAAVLKDSLASIDTDAERSIGNLNKNLASVAHAADDTADHVRTGTAPFTNYGRVAKESAAGINAATNAMEAQSNFADSLAAKIGGPLDEAMQKYQNDLTKADQLAVKSLISGNNIIDVLAEQDRAYANAAALRDEAIDKIASESDITGNLLGKLDAEVAARGKSSTALKAEELVREKVQAAQKLGISLSDDEVKSLEDQVAGRLALIQAGNYAQQLSDETAQINAEIAAMGKLTPLQQAALDIERKWPELLKLSSDARQEAIDKINAEASAKQRAQSVQGLTSDFNQVFNSTTDAVLGGANAWQAFGKNAGNALNSIAIKLRDDHAATKDWSKTIDDLGTAAQGALPAIGQLVGTIAGGGGNGAQVGSQVGGAIGTVVGSFFSAYGGNYWGPALGSLIGGAIGGAGDGNGTPAVYGSSIPGSGGRDSTAPVSTPLGIFASDTDNLADDAYKAFEATVKGFDQQLAKLFDPAQLDKVKASLDGWSGKFSDINALLQSRFDTILGTFDQTTQDFVNGFAADLQGRVQALADILAIGKTITAGNGISGLDLDNTITLINEFSTTGERATDTFTRLAVAAGDFDEALRLTGQTFDGTRLQAVEFAAKIADAAGGTQQADALWQSYFSHFYDTQEQAVQNLSVLNKRASDALSGLGLGAGIDQATFRQDFEAALPTLTPEQVATWLEAAKAIADASDAQAAYTAQLQKSAGDYSDFIVGLAAGTGKLSSFAQSRLTIEAWERDAIAQANQLAKAAGLQGASEQDLTLIHEVAAQKIADAISELQSATQDLVDKLYHGGQSVGDSTSTASAALGGFGHAITSVADAAKAAADLLLGDLSPLNDNQKLQYALSAFNRGLISKTDVLDVGHRLYGSSQPYVDLFNSLANRADPSTGGAGGGGSGGGSSFTSAQETAAQRHADAETIAQNVASLANAQHESFQDVASSLHLSLSALGKDLGLSSDDLNKYLQNAVDMENAIPDSLDGNTNRIIAALYDIAGLPPPVAPINDGGTTLNGVHGGRGGTATTFGANGDSSTVVTVPRGHSGHAMPVLQAPPAPTADPETTAIMRSVRDRLDTLIAATKSGTGEVVEAVQAVEVATGGVNDTVRRGTLPQSRNAR